ncbi:DUF4153 domain-containing protein [Providencia vermicola]|uniref:DUF7057 domain-containing protein n=1 Tax=Providencia TaxID=586 RepID=UPI0012B59E1E|nr:MULTISPECIES: DUF4153 domain-containing protein [unclassified Providencia]ELZ5941172.1 DUF4153 domain-containing protein [Providencia stuartii]MTB39777.1 DUF4153 domain-containing protein [Providencia sp. wls1949]MTC08013.1 DUF4153 domain-containing protein [Providencia sp. wls1948]
MGQQTLKESVSRYAYLFVALLAIVQATIILYSTNYSVQQEIGLSEQYFYLSLLLAIFVPSATSYLFTQVKAGVFYLNILIIILLTIWISLWQARHSASSSDAHFFLAFLTLTILFFVLLPWMQMRQFSGTWQINYACLISFYIKNTLLGILASVIGGLLTALILLASFLFQTVNLFFLHDILSHEFTLWLSFTLGFNIGLIFLRSNFELQLSHFVSYIARFFLIVLHVIAIVFVIGLLFSSFTELKYSDFGSITLLWFLLLNIILINLTYGDGSYQYQLPSWLTPFMLLSILLLNVFSFLSLYGIFIRVNQYSWSVERLYASTIALFFTAVVLAYSVVVILKRQRWVLTLGTINKVALLGLIATILLINSPIIDFQRITLNSLLAGVEKGKIEVNPMLARDLGQLGPDGKQALAQLKLNPDYKKQLEMVMPYDESRRSLKDVLVIAKNSADLPDSWWNISDKSYEWYCTASVEPNNCLGFMADVNQDGRDDVVMCYAYKESNYFDCLIWQQKEENWLVVDTQTHQYDSSESLNTAWNKLLNGQFGLAPKEWRQIVPK